MATEALFLEGGTRVIDPSTGDTVGFVWVEPAMAGGQLQRWVLSKLLVSSPEVSAAFTFSAWSEAPATLAAFLDAVRRVIPAGAEWGRNPVEDGLWPARHGAFYVVAQSSVAAWIEGMGLVFPDPVYPRDGVVAGLQARLPEEHGRPLAAPRPPQGPGGGRPLGLGAPGKPTGQTVVPFLEMHQWDTATPELVLDTGFGGGASMPFEGRRFFTGEELFFLRPSHRAASAPGQTARWREKNEDSVTNLTQLRSYIVSKFSPGDRVEVTGCNYYQDIHAEQITPPPVEFL